MGQHFQDMPFGSEADGAVLINEGDAYKLNHGFIVEPGVGTSNHNFRY